MRKLQHFSISFMLLALAVGCDDLRDPATSTQDSLDSVDQSFEGIDKEDKETQEKMQVVENFSITTSENQRSVILEWDDSARLTYTIIRATNLECKPLTQENCDNDVKYTNINGNSYVDSSISQGAQYYYWLIATIIDTSSSTSSTTKRALTASQQYVSEPKHITIPITDDLDNFIPERPGTQFPQDIHISSVSGSVVANWSYSQNYEVALYAGSQPRCNLIDFFNSQEKIDRNECAKFIGSSSNPPFYIPVKKLGNAPFIWAVVKNLLSSSDEVSANSHRVIGPYQLNLVSDVNSTDKSVLLIEQAIHDQHNIVIEFPHTNNLSTSTNYYLVIVNSSLPISIKKAQTRLDNLYADPSNAPTVRGISSTLRGFGGVDVKILKSENFIQRGSRLQYKVPVRQNTWYSVFLMASSELSQTNFLPAALKTATRVSIQVKGKYGLWQIHHNNKVQLALRTSGYFYPGLLNWRDLRIDGKVALPDRFSYSFTGCLFYSSKSGIGTVPLSDNVCLFSKPIDNSTHAPSLTSPLPIKFSVEYKATSYPCTNHKKIENTGYKRSRYFQASNTQKLLCDNRNLDSGSEAFPNYFAFVQPHNAAGEIARGKVEMWHAGTQAPVFINSRAAPLPDKPDRSTNVTACADFSPNGDKSCEWSAPIKVVRCNGYFVYKLTEVPGCNMSYALEEDEISSVHRLSRSK